MNILALEFPPISHLVEWPAFGWSPDGMFAVNKVVFLTFLSVAITLAIFLIAGSKAQLVPTGIQNLAEISVEFVRDQIILQVMGEEALHKKWVMPLLMSLFWFILLNNVWGIVPVAQMPVNARMAMPIFLGLLVWVVYNVAGVANQGPLHYLKSNTVPPGVPAALLPLVVPIEFLSNLIIRPFSLAVRLFANLLAGHILLVTFAVLTTALVEGAALLKVLAPLPLVILIGLTVFELLVIFLQAYIFTILTAVYIGGAMHPEH